MIFIRLGQQRVDCFQLLFFLKILYKFGEFDTMLNEVTELLIRNGDLGIVIGIKQEFNEREVGWWLGRVDLVDSGFEEQDFYRLIEDLFAFPKDWLTSLILDHFGKHLKH